MALPLYMLQMCFKSFALHQLAAKKKLPPTIIDPGYLIHCQLCSLFGKMNPAPFAIRNATPDNNIVVLAYTVHKTDVLKKYAEQNASAAALDSIEWSLFMQKQMPHNWKTGTSLSFSVAVCPVKRLGRGSGTPNKEVDVYEQINGSDMERYKTYLSWFKDNVERYKALKILSSVVADYRTEKYIRRTQGKNRKTIVIEHPYCYITGTLEISNPYLVNSFLLRGVGRHRKFGFGMLLLKPI